MTIPTIATTLGLTCVMLAAAGAEPPAAAPQTAPAGEKVDRGHDKPVCAVAFPHPLMTEVLFAVPTGMEGDANKDGKRQVSGDEFVELVNPHDRAIDLRGYTITDGSANTKTQLRFTFPAMLLPAHAIVVVFNGHDSKIPGLVGDAKGAPAGVNDSFSRAAVFSVRVQSSRVSFSNAGDAACLKAPDGKLVQRVRWGKADEKAGGTGFALDELAPVTSKGSVQRDGIGKDAAWKVHSEFDGSAFSPGLFAPLQSQAPATPPPPPAPATPTPATSPDPSAKPGTTEPRP